jgi:hypothetical protein
MAGSHRSGLGGDADLWRRWGFPVQERLEAREDEAYPLIYSRHDHQQVPLSLDSYEAGLVGIELRAWLVEQGVGGRGQHGVARLRCVGEVVEGAERGRIDGMVSVADGELKCVQAFDRQVDVPMLVYVREAVEGDERVDDIRRIPTLVRLECSRVGGGVFADPLAVVSGVPVAAGAKDGELDVLRLFLGRRMPQVLGSELPPAMIDRGTEVVQRVSDEESPFFWSTGYAIDPQIQRPRFLIELFAEGDRVGLSLACRSDLGAQDVQMELRPVQLGSRIG